MAQTYLIFISMVTLLFSSIIYLDTQPSETYNADYPNDELDIEALVLQSEDQKLIYGYTLFTATDQLIGPRASKVEKRITGNALQCTSCHLNDGIKPYGIPLYGVTERFPQYRGREDKIGTLAERINGCFTRSMNGISLDENSEEMSAMLHYIGWLDQFIPPKDVEFGNGLKPIDLPNRKVNLIAGEDAYQKHCALCHKSDGQGQKSPDNNTYIYPPLWGNHSYNNGAGMNRVITAAQFIKYNMPFGISHDAPILTDEEAYDVAGYINQQKRPQRALLEKDFPTLIKKPVSTPYPPYADDFSIDQHQLGPYQPIIAYYKEKYQITKTK
ncbi:MAG: c-type cytochrome [Bacteroidetes bacterium]|nr:c-type cytochrome [Bacteroidota bacterium]MDA0937489.1 c-type cytochrome [Bacteroidota bacterium]MDA1345112.1 c-type cytochrome [Bacteroidota bacterium]